MTKREQSERTRRKLLTAGQKLFTEQGYLHTSLRGIYAAANVDSGAFYYHFPSKRGFFAAVMLKVRVEHVRQIERCIREADGNLWERAVTVGIRAFLDAVVAPSFLRIVSLDGPAVLGRAAMSVDPPGLVLVRQLLRRLMAERWIETCPLEALSQTLWAMLYGAGEYIAHAEDREKAQQEVLQLLTRLMEGLRP